LSGKQLSVNIGTTNIHQQELILTWAISFQAAARCAPLSSRSLIELEPSLKAPQNQIKELNNAVARLEQKVDETSRFTLHPSKPDFVKIIKQLAKQLAKQKLFNVRQKRLAGFSY